MSVLSVQSPFPIFTDIDGQPLEDGFVWIGQTNLDPQVNPINVFWDAALTIPAGQPIRTLGGYPSNSGTPARLYVGSDYSIRVMNKNGSVVYSAPAATERYSDVVVSGVNAEDVIYNPPFLGGAQTNVEAKLAQTVSVKDFGAVGDGVTDDAAAIQAAIDSSLGNPIFAPSGTYRLNSGLVYDTSGNGVSAGLKIIGDGTYKTIFDNRSGGAAITCTSGVNLNDFQENVVLADFQITNPTSVANQTGIYFYGVIGANISSVKVTDHKYGFHAYSDLADASNSVHVNIEQSQFLNNSNIGVFCQGVSSGVNSAVNLHQCVIEGNVSGVVFYSMQNATIENCAIAYNSSRGLIISRDPVNPASYSKNCIVRNNEFDSNGGTQIDLGYAQNTELTDNLLIVNPGFAVSTQFLITSNSVSTEIRNSLPRCPAGITGVTMYDIGASAATLRILNTDWSQWSIVGNTKFVDASANSVILDENKWVRTPAQTVIAESNMPDNYQPDTSKGTIFRLIVNANTPIQLGTPLYPVGGQIITLIFINATAGALSLTLNSSYQQASFTPPASNKLMTAQYYYDYLAGKWRCIGNWSGDM